MINNTVCSEIRNETLEYVKSEVLKLKTKPTLVVVSIGSDYASSVYVKNKEKTCKEVGMDFVHMNLDSFVNQKAVSDLIEGLNKDESVTGIIIQLPVPHHINIDCIHIDSKKDVDCFNKDNLIKIYNGTYTDSDILPCTPSAVIKTAKRLNKLDGRNVTIVGRSNLVGRPLAAMFIKENATVTMCHSKTNKLAEHTRYSDITVTALGDPTVINQSMFMGCTTIIDVGINKDKEGKLCGDVDSKIKESMYMPCTPVPNGIGIVTTSELILNVLKAYKIQKEIK